MGTETQDPGPILWVKPGTRDPKGGTRDPRPGQLFYVGPTLKEENKLGRKEYGIKDCEEEFLG